MKLFDLWRERSISRELADPRYIAVTAHKEQLASLGAEQLLSFVNPDRGFWVVQELATVTDDIAVSVGSFRSFSDGDQDVLFRVTHKGRFGRWFADGFAIRDGTVSELTDDDWAFLD